MLRTFEGKNAEAFRDVLEALLGKDNTLAFFTGAEDGDHLLIAMRLPIDPVEATQKAANEVMGLFIDLLGNQIERSKGDLIQDPPEVDTDTNPETDKEKKA